MMRGTRNLTSLAMITAMLLTSVPVLAVTSQQPLGVKKNPTEPERTPFQARVIVNPQGEGVSSAALAIPAGKRLVIENISAIARVPDGLKMELNFFCYIDNNHDGVGDDDITFHRVTLTEQGVFQGISVYTANHKVLVFADELIGTGHYSIRVQARLNGLAATPAQAQVTFSGYVEDLPETQ